MRLLRSTGHGLTLEEFATPTVVPSYAILSHTWKDGDEVTFDDLVNGTGREKSGYEKILFCAQQAKRDGLQYFWIDTCCINKANDIELSHAINSMFRWYRNAARCYVYLSDVSSPLHTVDNVVDSRPSRWESDFQNSKWFTRGWTLQELLAPSSVEFFSCEGRRLGDKKSLIRQIQTATGIPKAAIQGVTPLSQFDVNQRMSWIEHRQTRLEEDRAYSLLGIFGVYILAIYGEGTASAFKRLMDEISKVQKCIQDLRATDPRDDKKRIKNTKGGLLEDSYRRVLENPVFGQWRDSQESQLLWIKGEPGTGKTKLLCGIINDIEQLESLARTNLLSYFFCQAADARINNATAVLRGLLYLLVDQHPSLVSHIRKRHDHAGKALFEDANAWVALTEIFTSILHDPNLGDIYLVVDALNECIVDLPKLLDFIVDQSSAPPHVKWIVSSRNWPSIKERLAKAGRGVKLTLELSAADLQPDDIASVQSVYGPFRPIIAEGYPGRGIGGYDLRSVADRAFPFDYTGSGKTDHLCFYRPGKGIFWILKNENGPFRAVYSESTLR